MLIIFKELIKSGLKTYSDLFKCLIFSKASKPNITFPMGVYSPSYKGSS